MGTIYTAGDLISLLKKQAGQLCLSVVIPFGQQDNEEVKKLKISQITSQVIQNLRQQHSAVFHQSETDLENIAHEVHYDRQCSGIGIFTCKEVREVFRFVYPVKEKFVLADKFDLCDLLFHAQYEQPGYILQLTRKGASLFLTDLHEITEIRNHHFPLAYSDDYEYARPAHASSNKGSAVTQQFEKDKSHLQEVRYEHFVKEVDRHLSGYLNHGAPYIITGVSKLLDAFERKSSTLQHLAGLFPGNFSRLPLTEMHQLTRHFFQQHVDNVINSSIRSLGEKAGAGLAAEGIADCWTAAMEGKGLLLLVEKDYRAVAFLEPGNGNHLHLTPPLFKHRIVTNAVNELLYIIPDKNGRVLMTENGALRNYHQIGLIKRYM